MLVSCLAFTACTSNNNEKKDYSDSKYVGSWKIDSMSFMDESENFDETWILTLNADGTGISEDKEGKSEFTWTPTDNGFKTKGSVNTTFTDDGENIKTTMLGVELHFIRQE